MGRELQKKKNRSSINKVTRRKQNMRPKINITGNQLVASQWDKTQTLAQNYSRLGLTHRLKNSTGGKERHPSQATAAPAPKSHGLKPQEAKITRGEDGSIISIEYAKDRKHETLGGDDGSDDEADNSGETSLVRALREQTRLGIKKERLQSDREVGWIRRLVEKHGDNYQAMFWDKELNIRQQSIGDIKKRVKKWQASQKSG
ncbi:hypothetical protein ABW19_dt0206191 [Dactylella cylindrospora]|nr:hypothetical protein ABW19_dt0206191 [Dactylella cylindrospora]